MDNTILTNIVFFACLLVAITVHEFAHAVTADRFGDPTPRSMGRVSLNPLRHLDPLGTLMLFVAHFGWGKPVPIDPYNLSKREELLVALAGPGSNFILALISGIILNFSPSVLISSLIFVFIQTNLVLGVFNLLPLPPLDGSKIFLNLLPEDKALSWQQAFDQYGIILLAILLFLPFGSSNFINVVISPVISFLTRLILLI